MRIIWITLSWLSGVWIGSKADLHLLVWLAAALCLLAAALFMRRSQRVAIKKALALSTFFCFGAMFFVWNLPTINEEHIAYYNEETAVVITGLVADQAFTKVPKGLNK